MTIYIDIVLLENLVINYILILSTAIISKTKINYISILISSIVGSLYAVINYMAKIDSFLNFFIKIIISVIMIMISFPNIKFRKIIKNIISKFKICYLSSALNTLCLLCLNARNEAQVR